MSPDISRQTFSKERHYRKVVAQQGRLQLDSDLNEQTDIYDYINKVFLQDIIGDFGAPKDKAGFKISCPPDVKNLIYTIKKGHYYVHGILCENELENLRPYEQSDLPLFSPTDNQRDSTSNTLVLPYVQGHYLAYLDVWERDINYLDDPSIREVALGGVDTAARLKTTWQVKLLKLDDDYDYNADNTSSCKSVLHDKKIKPRGMLKARLYYNQFDGKKNDADSGNSSNSEDLPKQPSFPAMYTEPENQLYRIEIHHEGKYDQAGFKWSADNASFERPLLTPIGITEKTLNVPMDEKTTQADFPVGKWLEIIDERLELWGMPGIIVKITNVEASGNRYIITFDSSAETNDLSHYYFEEQFNPKIRRWDGYNSKLSAAADEDSEFHNPGDEEYNVYISLGTKTKIQVSFKNANDIFYKTGDYWLIAARTMSSSIEWPCEKDKEDKPLPNNPLPLPPRGIEHHYCPLALLRYKFDDDCTIKWNSLTTQDHHANQYIDDKNRLIDTIQSVADIEFDQSSLQEIRRSTDHKVITLEDNRNSFSIILDENNGIANLVKNSKISSENGQELVYRFAVEDGELLKGTFSSFYDCRQLFLPSAGMSHGSRTGIIKIPIEPNNAGHLVYGPFKHFLMTDSPPAVILALDSESEKIKDVLFMEDFLAGDALLRFKAIHINSHDFYISLEGSHHKKLKEYLKEPLRLRWWAISAAEIPDVQTGRLAHGEEIANIRRQNWFVEGLEDWFPSIKHIFEFNEEQPSQRRKEQGKIEPQEEQPSQRRKEQGKIEPQEEQPSQRRKEQGKIEPQEEQPSQRRKEQGKIEKVIREALRVGYYISDGLLKKSKKEA
jgi:Family of unknown function (DUF6519)